MPLRARTALKQVAEERGIEPWVLTRPGRKHHIFHARAEVARRMSACGYSTPQIGKFLNHDHTTILFYLGRFKKKPGAERPPKPPKKKRWKPPRVRHLRWIGKPKDASKRHLIPYAGADMTEYVWRPRPQQEQRT